MLEGEGYRLKQLWEESLKIVDEEGVTRYTAFVLADESGRVIDIHVLAIDGAGTPKPLWSNDESFDTEDLAGLGEIDGVEVRCMSAAMQLERHEWYDLPEEVGRSIELLRDRYGSSR